MTRSLIFGSAQASTLIKVISREIIFEVLIPTYVITVNERHGQTD